MSFISQKGVLPICTESVQIHFQMLNRRKEKKKTQPEVIGSSDVIFHLLCSLLAFSSFPQPSAAKEHILAIIEKGAYDEKHNECG